MLSPNSQSIPPWQPAFGELSDHQLQLRLCAFNRVRLNPSLPRTDWEWDLRKSLEQSLLEGRFVENERQTISALMDEVPTETQAFIEWFENLLLVGPGQNDPLFEWLATTASAAQMKWFIKQEVAGEAGFDDLVALTQLKASTRPKLEMARNYWDEMGRGSENGMHGPMLARLARELEVEKTPVEDIVTESLSLANLLVAFAANRRYAYQSIGALGAIELTAPGRAQCVLRGLERLGYQQAAQYYRLHATLDVKHSKEWNAEVILPLVENQPEVIRSLAEGAWLRLEFGARCFRRYRIFLGLNGSA